MEESSCDHDNETWIYIKSMKIFLLSERLLPFQEEFCTLELGN